MCRQIFLIVLAAAFLKRHTDIADDKIFARLVEQQGKNLDDFAEAVATNHRLADAVGVELASDSAYGLKRLDISAEQIASELKVSSANFNLGEIVFTTSTKDTASGYKFIQELSDVDVYDEAYALHLLLHRGGGLASSLTNPYAQRRSKRETRSARNSNAVSGAT